MKSLPGTFVMKGIFSETRADISDKNRANCIKSKISKRKCYIEKSITELYSIKKNHGFY